MPRRTSSRNPTTPATVNHTTSSTDQPYDPSQSPLLELRRQWKWAAFSQFFITFNTLFAMNDVSLTDFENDLVGSTNIHLPRVMQRLLSVLTQDRKISLDNWQTALRRQYYRRDPQSNPIGSEPLSASVKVEDISVPPPPVVVQTEDLANKQEAQPEVEQQPEPSRSATPFDDGQTSHVADLTSLGGNGEPLSGEAVESKDWLDLPMLTKLDSLHHLIEWQFHNPIRLRTAMKDDDETANWRTEPIGYDAKRNVYWLIGGDRLWIQRELPKPKPRKRKRTETANKSRIAASTRHTLGEASKRHRNQQANTTAVALDAPERAAGQSNQSRRRAAKTKAKMMLDIHAKELAELQRLAAIESRESHHKAPPTRPLGTRVSARLRGANSQEEWQAIPDEWLAGFNASPDALKSTNTKESSPLPERTRHSRKTGLESDLESISELTELSEEVQVQPNGEIQEGPSTPGTVDPSGADVKAAEETEPGTNVTQVEEVCDRDLENIPTAPEGFIEWETICVSLDEWEHIPERFANATHYAEKALYKVLTQDIVPVVTEELRETERKRRMEEAVVHRKRSSRIAIKESEREEARTVAKKRAEEEERQARARRLQARLEKEEADRAKREMAREQRKREREAKELQQAQKRASETRSLDAITNSTTGNARDYKTYGNRTLKSSVHSSGSRTPSGDDWELDCEICMRRGINVDDGLPMMCCSSCSKWQHIPCHDNADKRAGRPQRNWETEDFVCRRCYSQKAQSSTTRLSTLQQALSEAGLPLQPHYLYQNQATMSSVIPRASGAHTSPQPRSTYGNFAPQPSTSYPRNPITFAHYQPQQRGFSSQTHQVQPFVIQNHPPSQQSSLPTMNNGATPLSVQRPNMHLAADSRWPTPTSAPAYATYISGADETVDYARAPDYSTYKGHTNTLLQWQPTHPHPRPNPQPLRQLSQLQYHQTTGPTSYQS